MSQNEKTLTRVPTRDTLVNILCTSVLCSHRGKNIHTSGVTAKIAFVGARARTKKYQPKTPLSPKSAKI